jgi:RimJ/RimL family protein N-acetyltransferase
MRVVAASHCTLEPLVAGHAPEMFEVLGDPAIYEFENEPPPSPQWLAARYALLESRCSGDGSELWLNWVVRLPGGPLAGVVQATVLPSGLAYVAYELNSRHWRRGIGGSAVRAMAEELRVNYGVHTLAALLKAANFRSLGLLRSLGFVAADAAQRASLGAEPDEIAMVRPAGPG